MGGRAIRMLAAAMVLSGAVCLSGCGMAGKPIVVTDPDESTSVAPKDPDPDPTAAEEPFVLPVFAELDEAFIGWGVRMRTDGTAPDVTEEWAWLLNRYNAYYADTRDSGGIGTKNIYLLFSASYDNGNMPLILDILREKTVPAVFYLVGDFVRAYPDLVRRLIDEGHALGNHSDTHPSLPRIGDEALVAEIQDYHRWILETFQYKMRYFMPPSGEFNEKVLALADRMGYITQFWSLAYDDYDPSVIRGADYAYDLVMRHLHGGAFVFLHSVSADNRQALGRLIDAIRTDGYTFRLFEP